MKNIFKIYFVKHTVVTLIAVLSILDVLLLGRYFYTPYFQFLIDQHVFEVVVLLTLVQILLLLSTNVWQSTPSIIGSEEEAQRKIKSILDQNRSIDSVKVLSAGLGSRASFFRSLLEQHKGVKIEIVACFGKESPNPDNLDRLKLGPAQFNVLTNRPTDEVRKHLEIFNSYNTPSFRCILLSDSHGPHSGILGWYTYHKQNKELVGRRNMQIYVSRSTETGFILLNFAEKMFGNYANESEAKLIWPRNRSTVKR
jgi:hypothetical protein